uniref:Uncharacterized protein n=1 Tax=Trypanosoma congolense (strain IL3000) TaxID=1068625 RepID=G0UM59_TRYCI|nr:conserved hypothetical protein [Trypanosoma congolense IL3000]
MIALKSAVNTRCALSERVPSPSRMEKLIPSLSSLHHGVYTTFDHAYGSAPVKSDPSRNNRYLTLVRLSHQQKQQDAGGLETITSVDDNKAVDNGARGCNDESTQSQPNLNTSMKKSNLSDGVVVRHNPCEWLTEKQASSALVQPMAVRDFYSTARKIERIDDDKRSGLVGNTQRTVDIMRKRAANPALCPPPDVFTVFPQQRRLLEIDSRGQYASNCLDIVDCQRPLPLSEQNMSYEKDPLERLAPCLPVSGSPNTQRRLLTRMSTSMPLFAGTAKAQKYTIPNYAGHVPSSERNISALHGNDSCVLRKWSKSYLTLATHGSGVDTACNGKNPLLRTRRGNKAPEAKVLKPKSAEVINMTVEGAMLQATLVQSTGSESLLNPRLDKRPRKIF